MKESLSESSGGRELGFNKSKQKKTGVRSCSSFTWAMDPNRLKNYRRKLPQYLKDKGHKEDEILVEDEYGTIFSMKQFLEILDDCPIHYHDSIGTEFS